jgi:hypothetical protein
MLGGLARAVARAREIDVASRQLALLFLLSIVAFMLCALIYWSLQLPAYGSAKSIFALFLVAPIAMAIAEGLAALDSVLRRWNLLVVRVLLYGWLGTFCAVSFLAFAG